MAGFDNETVYANNWDFRGVQPVIPQVTQEGELPIGTGASPAIEVGQITSPNGSIVVGYDNPDITLQVDPSITGIQSIDVDTSTPPGTDPVVPNMSGQITVTGGQTAAGNVGANVIRTHSEAANAYTTEIQRASAEASSTLAANGVSHFDSEFFTVDGDGFVSLAGEGAVINFDVDTASGTGTDPVVPDTNGTIALTGAQVPAGTIANVIRTHSTTASSITTEIQQSSAQASSTPTANGVSHFDSGFFTVDGDGFVSLAGEGTIQSINVDANTPPGTDPVLPSNGEITVTGAQVAAGTVGANVIRTNSLAANSYTTEIQRASAEASSTLAANGVSHYDDSFFTVDANGFVSLAGGAATLSFNIDAATNPGTDPVVPDGSGQVTVTGAQVVAGTVGANVIRTHSTAANQYSIEIQQTAAVASTDADNNGVAHFDSEFFTVDGNGFVSLAGGGASVSFNVDAATNPGTDPVVPDGSGQVTVTGAQVAAGTVGANVIRTNSLAANTWTTEIQRSTAVASSASANNGVCHFDSSQFTVDANGFVQVTSFTPNPFTTFELVEDFLAATGINDQSYAYGESTWYLSGLVSRISDVDHPGIVGLAAGVNGGVLSKCGNGTSAASESIRVGGGEIIIEWILQAGVLGTSTHIYAGLGNYTVGLPNIGAPPNDGIGFLVSTSLTSSEWLGRNAASGTTTTAASGITLSAGTWLKLSMIINAAGTSVSYFINDSEISGSPITTNIPTGIGMTPYVWMDGGPTTRVYIDLFHMKISLTNARY